MFDPLFLFRIGIDRKTVKKYKALFNSELGREVLIDMNQRFHAFDGSYVPNDPDETKHREGQASVPRLINKLIAMNPNDLINATDEIIRKNKHVTTGEENHVRRQYR